MATFRIKRTANAVASPTVAEITAQLGAASDAMTAFKLQIHPLVLQAPDNRVATSPDGLSIDFATAASGEMVCTIPDGPLDTEANRKKLMKMALLAYRTLTGIPFADITLDQVNGGAVPGGIIAEFTAVKAPFIAAPRAPLAAAGIGALVAPAAPAVRFNMLPVLANAGSRAQLNAALAPHGYKVLAPLGGGNPDPNHESNCYRLKHGVGPDERFVQITSDGSFLGPKTVLDQVPGGPVPITNDPAVLEAEATKILKDIMASMTQVVEMKRLGLISDDAFPYNVGAQGGAMTPEGKAKFNAIKAKVDARLPSLLNQSFPNEVAEGLFQVQVRRPDPAAPGGQRETWEVPPAQNRPAFGR